MTVFAAFWKKIPFFSIIFASLGTVIFVPGVYLLSIGGSIYYAFAGLALLLTGFLNFIRSPQSARLYALVIFVTLFWALYEVELRPWSLLPRLVGPAILGLYFLIPKTSNELGVSRGLRGTILAGIVLSLGILPYSYVTWAFVPVSGHSGTASNPISGPLDWRSVGGDSSGTKFALSDQISTGNVDRLKARWTFRASDADFGDVSSIPNFASRITFQNTPLNVGRRLYVCLGNNVVVALDSETGKRLWRFDPKINATGAWSLTCRGLAYHEAGTNTGKVCDARLLMGTVDDRLTAIDASSGIPCPDFGVAGFVNLSDGLGNVIPGYHYVTSPPTIIGNVAVIGARILDNQSTDMPSGVIRGFDVTTGQLVWAWDMLHPSATRQRNFPRSTPNAWAIFTGDQSLGLVYVPTGSTTPDHFGVQRTADQDRYAASMVALDVRTGDVRWSFQTVHHDLWDYDIAAQPVLTDTLVGGTSVPTILVPTKRGEIFALDRRTGRPVFPVEERAVPAGGVSGERLSPTQPYATGLPSLAPQQLTEADMWGATPIDLLFCRIKFRQLRYQGQFTPPSTQGTIVYPSTPGVINWGGVSVDRDRQILVVNTNNLASVVRLIKRNEANKLGIVPYQETISNTGVHSETSSKEIYAQAGTPYAVTVPVFTSFLGFPCNAPPWGNLSAIDLKTRKLLWSQPLGTTSEVAPLGIALPTGIMTQGGAMTTRSGLTFIGAAFESKFRAFETQTGKLLWQADLPAPGRATPMSYTSSKTGRQFIIVASGGRSKFTSHPEAHLTAFSMPD
jgi:quinoprotein glucose dehydrogenase